MALLNIFIHLFQHLLDLLCETINLFKKVGKLKKNIWRSSDIRGVLVICSRTCLRVIFSNGRISYPRCYFVQMQSRNSISWTEQGRTDGRTDTSFYRDSKTHLIFLSVSVRRLAVKSLWYPSPNNPIHADQKTWSVLFRPQMPSFMFWHVLFRCAIVFLQEGVSVRPSVRPQLFSDAY